MYAARLLNLVGQIYEQNLRGVRNTQVSISASSNEIPDVHTLGIA